MTTRRRKKHRPEEIVAKRPNSESLRADIRKTPLQGGEGARPGSRFRAGAASGGGGNPLASRSSVGRWLRKCH